MYNNYYPFVNLPLNFAYDSLEPYIDEKTMHLHHDRHLQTYIDNLNDVLKDNPRLQRLSLEQLIISADRLPCKLRDKVKNNAGGVFNHRFFFDGLRNPSENQPSGALEEKINRQFGSFSEFKAEFKKAALSVFGSGYAWLVGNGCGLKIITTPNQNCPIAQGFRPIITVDVWEHAYYLKHYNLRGDYIDDWFKIINWEQAEKNSIL